MIDPYGTNIEDIGSLLILPSGKIILGGSSQNQADASLASLNPDGSLDSTFGTNGIILTPLGPTPTNNNFSAIQLQPDGKIIGAGYASNGSYLDWALARYTLPLGTLCTPNPTSIQANFNGTSIPAGDSILFTGVLKIQGLPANQTATVFFDNQAITFTANGFTYNTANAGMPDAQVTIDPSATQASTTFDTTTGTWMTVTPPNTAGNIFLSGYVFAPSLFGQSGGLPGGISPVTWTGTIRVLASVPLTVKWQWAAAVYTSLGTDNNALGIKPVDDNQASQYKNADHAGTPENFKSFVTGGARGGGGSNYTGSLSGTANVSCAS